jgi:ABC-type uncharacterized transport system YnjBCD permease subunit
MQTTSITGGSMKVLAIIALLLGVAAIGASTFAKVETHGNYEYMKETIERDGPATAYDLPLLEEYASTLKTMHLVAWAAGALALVLGLIALSKRKISPVPVALPAAAMVAGLLGIGLSLLSAPPWA